MPDGLTYGQPVLPGFPVPPPSPELTMRVITLLAIEQLKHAGTRLGSMEVAALAACLEVSTGGDVRDLPEAQDALDEAEQMRRYER